MERPDRARSYWRDNLRLVGLCLVVWFVVSFGLGILLLDVLDRYRLGGFPLGFWFAQQGSIYVFVALIFFYARRMAAIDRAYEVEQAVEDDAAAPPAEPGDAG